MVLDGHIPESLAVFGDQPLGNSPQAFFVGTLLLFRLAEFQYQLAMFIVLYNLCWPVFVKQAGNF